MEQELRNKVKEAASEYFNKILKEKLSMNHIPPSGKMLDENDLLNLIDASLDMQLTGGKFNKEFEKDFALYLNTKYALSVNSGSSANLTAISTLTSYKLKERRLLPNDEIITVAAGFPTTINPIIQNNLIPVFVDCKIGTYNIDPMQIEQAISSKTKCIFIAHTLGNSFNLDKIISLCKKYNLWLIEDTCDALGGEYRGKKLGTFGDISTFSFYPAHHITMGEGGALAFNNSLLYEIAKSFRDWGRDCHCPPGVDGVCAKRFSRQHGKLPFGFDHKYTYSHAGYNLKITDMQAAIGCSQLKKLPQFLKKREENANLLMSKLMDLEKYFIFPQTEQYSKSAWFGFLISVKETAPFTKQELVQFLEKNDIGTRQLFSGNVLRQPYFSENEIKLRILNSDILISKDLKEEHFKMLPNTEFIMNNTFWLGVFPGLQEKEINKIADTIHNFIREKLK